MKKPLVLSIILLTVLPALALDLHPDYRYAFGACPTWGSGRFSEVQAYIRVKETWNTLLSNYPVGWSASTGMGDCRYKGDPAPMPKQPGEFLVPGNLCRPKFVTPKVCAGGPNDTKKCHLAVDCPMGACVPGTLTATSYPWSYIAFQANYNEGWSSVSSGCVWDPWAYGAPPA